MEWLLPLILWALFFLTFKKAVPTIVYVIIATLVALFYLPFRLFADKQPENKSLYLISRYLCAIAICFSILFCYLPSSESFIYMMYVICLINIIFIIVSYINTINTFETFLKSKGITEEQWLGFMIFL
jgi:hypothetical protein